MSDSILLMRNVRVTSYILTRIAYYYSIKQTKDENRNRKTKKIDQTTDLYITKSLQTILQYFIDESLFLFDLEIIRWNTYACIYVGGDIINPRRELSYKVAPLSYKLRL